MRLKTSQFTGIASEVKKGGQQRRLSPRRQLESDQFDAIFLFDQAEGMVEGALSKSLLGDFIPR